MKKNVRKATRKSQCIDFESYLEDCTKRYSFVNTTDSDKLVPWSDEIKDAIKTLWNTQKDKYENIEIYTALQSLLQNAAESLVLMDRLFYLKEQRLEAFIIPTMNRSLSPRCYAIVSNKNSLLS